MSNHIGGEAWFPVTGSIILRECIPIASVQDEKERYNLIKVLTESDRGVRYTCISSNGWFSSQVDKDESDKQDTA